MDLSSGMSISTIDMADLMPKDQKKQNNKKENLKETKADKKPAIKKESDLSEIAKKDNDAK